MEIALSKEVLGLMAGFAERHGTGSIWVTDGAHTQCAFAAAQGGGAGNGGALAVKYPLASGLALLVEVDHCRGLDREERSGLERIAAAMDSGAL